MSHGGDGLEGSIEDSHQGTPKEWYLERSEFRVEADLIVLQLQILLSDGGLHSCMALLRIGGRCQKALLLSLRPATLLRQRGLILLGIPGRSAGSNMLSNVSLSG